MQLREQYHDLVRRDVFPFLAEHVGSVLDFGGGVGATAAYLRARGRASRAVLFDQVADNALTELDAVEAVDLDNRAAVQAALDRTGPFDTILALDVLEHLKDPWGSVAMLDNALRPGGRLIVSLPNVAHYSVLGPLLFKARFAYADAGILDRTHLRWFTGKSAIELVTHTGLTDVVVDSYVGGRRNRLLNALSFRLFERYFTFQYKICASKPPAA